MTTPKSQAELPQAIGPYKVSRELGRGAFGVVYRGLDAALNRDVAIKVLNRSALSSQKAVERFKREAQVVAGMHHGHVVPVYQFGEYEGGYYIASRFIAGRSLSDAIPEDGLPAAKAVEWTAQLLDALAYAHSLNVLHRDVKPDNALLDEKGRLFLTDFGLAGWVGQAEMTQEGSVMGTPVYMSPEQARGSNREVGPAADQYSAGVVFYELLTGHRPFESGNVHVILHNVISTPPPPLSEWRKDVDPELEAICLKALQKKPAGRFSSCEEMLQALRDWQGRTQPKDALPIIDTTPVPPPLPRPKVPTSMRQTHASTAGRRTQAAPPPPQFVAEPDLEEEPEPRSGGRGTLLLVGLGGALLALLLTGAVVGYLVLAKGEDKQPKMNKDLNKGDRIRPPKDL